MGTRLIFGFCLAGGAALATVGPAVHAAELFPYNPPSQSRQIQQRSVGLSAEEMRRIEELARQIARLPPAQKESVRAEVLNDLNRAARRQDMRQVRFYNELLRRIDSDR